MRVQNVYLALTSNDWSASATSESIEIEHVGELSLHVVISSAVGLSGTLSIQGSNIPLLDDTGTHWVDLSTTPITSGSGILKYLIPLASVPCKYVRVSWIRSAGSGTADYCNMFTKGF